LIEGFFIGVISATSLTAGIFFLRFWKQTRDSFFLAFAASFLMEGLNRIGVLFLTRPNEGNAVIYSVRLLAFLLILVAIIRKNYGKG